MKGDTMTYIKVNNTLYPSKIDGRIADYEWDRRDTKSITLSMTYAEVLALLPELSHTPLNTYHFLIGQFPRL